mgnify:CR=1 FL=1
MILGWDDKDGLELDDNYDLELDDKDGLGSVILI